MNFEVQIRKLKFYLPSNFSLRFLVLKKMKRPMQIATSAALTVATTTITIVWVLLLFPAQTNAGLIKLRKMQV